ncbi:SPOR domain-containing protein [Balneola sp. MJW-20]|uniref:SPOR domain-containing protein n=1 Tax=Gracilimonas aurantiaca TaxID=3234185 RepID=UPI0034662297
MKKLSIYTLAIGFFLIAIQGCGPSEEERRAREQARLDSLRQVEKQRIEALMAQARQDSAAQAQQDTPEETTTSATGMFAEDGSYAVQVGAWRSQEKAQEMANMLSDRDYPDVYTVMVGDESTGNVWYRVRIGFFATEADAADLGARLAEELNTGYWVSKAR